jgi:sterol desaturase/sphingolipid hydroxylase (fatty acid hydroxylase superfamily)
MMHYAIHHAKRFDAPLLRRIRQHHLAHHFRDTRRGFGVSSPFWDRVFRS